MFQGCGSNVGKSLVVAGLCRAFTRRGFKVLPFKPQNMSNNAAVTADGGEIGRAQALQALACETEPLVDMNPVLLKPETDTGAQVVVQGKRWRSAKAREYQALRAELMTPVLESFARLRAEADLVLIEGAGSPAETNLRERDIANMGFAQAADVPVILIGDIDRGGVIAQMVGTSVVLNNSDQERIKGFLINKFRGDVSLFDEGAREIARRTGWCNLGVLPWFDDAGKLPAEDILDISGGGSGEVKIAVPRLSRIANFDDLDPLKNHDGVRVVIVDPGEPLPGDAQLVILPGSKSTISDLAFFRAQGWDIDLMAHVRRGGSVLGICGGYQMLGQEISDLSGVEGLPQSVAGLALLNVKTRMEPTKNLGLVTCWETSTGLVVSGYEIHMGETTGTEQTWLKGDVVKGVISPSGQIFGTYLHGLFANDTFRNGFLAGFGVQASQGYNEMVERVLDRLAVHLETHTDLDAMLVLAGE